MQNNATIDLVFHTSKTRDFVVYTHKQPLTNPEKN